MDYKLVIGWISLCYVVTETTSRGRKDVHEAAIIDECNSRFLRDDGMLIDGADALLRYLCLCVRVRAKDAYPRMRACVRAHTHTCTFLRAYDVAHMYVCAYARMHVRTYACVHVRTSACMHVRTCVCLYARARTWWWWVAVGRAASLCVDTMFERLDDIRMVTREHMSLHTSVFP